MRIELLMPYVLTEAWVQMAVNRYAPFARSTTELYGRDLSDVAPAVVTAERTPHLVAEQALRAQNAGADTCIIDCFYEAGLEESRVALQIPIVGAGEAGMLLAYGLGAPFTVLTSDQEGLSIVPTNAERYGFSTRLHSVVSIDLPWQEIPDHPEEALLRMEREAMSLPSSVHTIVIGCTELAEMSQSLHDRLSLRGREVRVVNPIGAALGLAEMRFAMGT